jgi:GABA permease
VVLVLYVVTRWQGGSVAPEDLEDTTEAKRIVVLANQTIEESALHEALHRIDGSEKAEYFVVVPANPVDTGDAEREGAAFVWEAAARSAAARLEQTLATLRGQGLTVDGELGDYRPLVALDKAMREFRPDHVVISTHPSDRSSWLRHGVVADARERYDVPVQHVVAQESVVGG